MNGKAEDLMMNAPFEVDETALRIAYPQATAQSLKTKGSLAAWLAVPNLWIASKVAASNKPPLFDAMRLPKQVRPATRW